MDTTTNMAGEVIGWLKRNGFRKSTSRWHDTIRMDYWIFGDARFWVPRDPAAQFVVPVELRRLMKTTPVAVAESRPSTKMRDLVIPLTEAEWTIVSHVQDIVGPEALHDLLMEQVKTRWDKAKAALLGKP